MDEKENKNIQRKLTLIMSLTTLSVPLFYLIGYFYTYGYLSIFGLSNEYFPKSIQDYLVLAFESIQGTILSSLPMINKNYFAVLIPSGIVFVISIVLMLTTYFFLRKAVRAKIRVTKIIRKRQFKHILFPFIMSGVIFVLPYLIISLLVLVSVVPLVSYPFGQAHARDLIKEYRHCKYEDMTTNQWCVSITKDGKILQEGMFIAKSDKYIGIWNGKALLYPLTDELIVIKHGLKKK